MTKWTIYKCDICGKEFEDDEEACVQCERGHLLSEYKNAIHIYNYHKKPLNIMECEPDDAYYVICDDEEAAQTYKEWTDYYGCCCPYDKNGYEEGLWFYDGDNKYGSGGNWVHLPTIYENLGELLSYFQS